MNMKIRHILVALLMTAGAAWAGTFRVHYSIRGSGRDITVQAESSAEARRTVMDIIPGAVVTGAHLKRPPNPPNGKSGNRLELTCPAKEKEAGGFPFPPAFLSLGWVLFLPPTKAKSAKGYAQQVRVDPASGT